MGVVAFIGVLSGSYLSLIAIIWVSRHLSGKTKTKSCFFRLPSPGDMGVVAFIGVLSGSYLSLINRWQTSV
jgi:hypothetical protein